MKNGKSAFAVIVLILFAMAITSQAAERLVLLDNQTNTSWGGCYSADLVLDQLVISYPDDFVVVTYHAWWPSPGDPFYVYNIPENSARINYYPPHPDGYRYTPYAFVDGVYRGYTYNSWGSWIQSRRSIESPLVITLGGSFNSNTRDGVLDITIYAESEITLSGLHVRIALCEDSLYYQASNGTLWHNYTMRDMIPSATGEVLNISQGETVELSQEFSAPDPLDLDFCYLVVWVQADQSDYEVLQAAKIGLGDFQTSIDDELVGRPISLQLNQNYPNPFNAHTTINYALPKPSYVTIEVFDLLGRKVETLVDERQHAGYHQATWNADDFSSGVYFYKLQAGDYSESKRMVLLK